MTEDRLILAVAFGPALTLALLGWVGVLDVVTFPAANAIVAAVGCAMFVWSALSAGRIGIEGTAVANTVTALVLAVYAVGNGLLATHAITDRDYIAVARPLFPMLVTSVVVGPAMFRRWRNATAERIRGVMERIEA